MFKLIKALLKIFIGLIIILMVATIGIITFVNPNEFKPAIEQAVLEQTGHVLKLQGPLTWKWYPILSLGLEDVVLENTPPFKGQFFSAKSISAGCDLISAVSGKVILNLKVHGFNLILDHNVKGQNNWDDLQKRFAKTNDTSPNNQSQHFLLNGITIEEGQVIYHDEEKNNHYMVDHLNLSAENIYQGFIGILNPFSLGLHVEDLNKRSLGSLALTGKWSLEKEFTEANVKNIALKFDFPDGKSTVLNGEVTIQNLNQTPTVQGHIESKNFDIKPWLNDLNTTPNEAIPTVADITATFKYFSPYFDIESFNIHLKNNGELSGNIKLDITSLDSKIPNFEGDFLGKQLQYNKIVLDQLKGKILSAKNSITIAPMDFQIAKSQQHATLQINMQGNSPQFTITEEGQDFEVNELLTLFGLQQKLEGKTHFKMKLTTQGHDMAEWRHYLSGHVDLFLSNGKFYGANLIDLLKNAQSTVYTAVSAITKKLSIDTVGVIQKELESWKTTTKKTNAFTPFDSLSASLNISNGVINNPDLAITHSEYGVTGNGTINLNNEALQYQVSTSLKNNPYPGTDKLGTYIFKTPLSIKISGTIQDPVIRPDLDSYMNSVLGYAQKELVEQVIDKAINKAVNKAINLPGGEDNPINKTVNKAIGDLLKQRQ